MLEFKHIKKLLSVHSKNIVINILNFGIVENNKLIFTDLDYKLSLDNVDLKDGTIIDITEYKKNNNIQASIDTNCNSEEFPVSIIKHKLAELPNNIFNNISSFTNFCNNDYTNRITLTSICYNLKDGEICATNGHVLHKSQIKKDICEKRFNVPNKYSTVIQYIHDILGINNVTLYDLNLEENEEKEYLVEIVFNGGVFEFKCVSEIYPDYNHVIPDINQYNLIEISEDNKQNMLNVLSIMTKYTSLGVYLFDNVCACKKEDKIFYTELKFNLFTNTRYLNVEYFKIILSNIKSNFSMYYNNENILSPCVIVNGDDTFIIMPLRYEEENIDNINDSIKDKSAIYIDIEEPKIQKKKQFINSILKIIKDNQDKNGKEILEIISKEK